MREDLLSRTFVELADTLVDNFDVVELMVLLTERTVELTDGSASGLLLLDPRGGLRVIAATSDAVETLDLFQIQSDEGPCRDCCRTGAAVIADDLSAHAERWPHFVPEALRAGYQGVHAFPLRVRDSIVGALGVFRTGAEAMPGEDVALAQALADVATIALMQAQALSDAHVVAAQLQGALASRVVIEQAKGVVAEQANLDMDAAFNRLRSYARSHQQRLTDIAEDVVAGTVSADTLA